ncbi:hypothetical protein NMG60_11037005 [Bertholletia excelsa]
MGDRRQHGTTPSRPGLRHHTGGEIVEVQGGHIVRSTGRKDRHSKVCTAKGPRDRRVRLSAHTAIQFYDVQDRLGYDRPSKAVDWLIKKAKPAIDELAKLPAWKPTSNFEQNHAPENQPERPPETAVAVGLAASSSIRSPAGSALPGNNDASFLPPTLDNDPIADTMQSFFPVGPSAGTGSSPVQFPSFPTEDLLSRTSGQSQDLRLSLQSFQHPILLHHHHESQHHQTEEQTLFSGTNALGYDVAWNAGEDAGAGGGGFLNSPSTPPSLQPLFGQNHLFLSQGGPLQSSNNNIPLLRAWIDPSSSITATSAAAGDHLHYHQNLPINQSSLPAIGFTSFRGFHIPARIHGEEVEHDGISDKPSSASSDSLQ